MQALTAIDLTAEPPTDCEQHGSVRFAFATLSLLARSATSPPTPTRQISPSLPTTSWPRPGAATTPRRRPIRGRRRHAPLVLRQAAAEDGECPAGVIGGG